MFPILFYYAIVEQFVQHGNEDALLKAYVILGKAGSIFFFFALKYLSLATYQ